MLKLTRARAAVVGGAAATALVGGVLIASSTASVSASAESDPVAAALEQQPATPEPTTQAEPKIPLYYLPPAAPAPAADTKQSKRMAKAFAKKKGDPFPVIAPIDGAPVTGSFGTTGPHWAVAHSGSDISATTGTPVKAVVGGTIKSIFVHPAYGTVVRLVRKDDVEIWYCHLSKPLVLPGQHVDQGAIVGEVGATGNTTGPHLHIEVRVNHIPTDPLQFFLTTPGKPAPAPAWAAAYREDPPPGSSIL
ncbi:MAG: M23 family metallopeptidase [Actinobacteria bacterium]|nr:M23 family metallopeptidase [Actinomycetota bacterium]